MLSLLMVIIGLGNGLLPVWGQAIVWINDDHLSIGPLGTNFNVILQNMTIFI